VTEGIGSIVYEPVVSHVSFRPVFFVLHALLSTGGPDYGRLDIEEP